LGGRTLDRPGIDRFARRCNPFEHAGEPQCVAVWETVADAIAAAWPQVDLCAEAGDTSGSPPLNKQVGVRPGGEKLLRSGANRAPYDQRKIRRIAASGRRRGHRSLVIGHSRLSSTNCGSASSVPAQNGR
jgi:hypothetical protein